MSEIWEETDPLYLRAVKMFFYAVAALGFGWWLLPLRDLFVKQGWQPAIWLANNVPNGLTLLRGVASLPITVLFAISLWQNDPNASRYFYVVIGLFLLDAIDGPLARQLNYRTQFGAKADPTVDKVLMYGLALSLPLLLWHNYGYMAADTIIGLLVWMGYVEYRIVRTSLRANRLANQIGANIHGAFGAGKTKFGCQVVGFAICYAVLVWGLSFTSFWLTIASGAFALACWFANKSLADHHDELFSLEQKAREMMWHEATQAS